MKRPMWLGGALVVLIGVGVYGIVHFEQGGPRPALQPSAQTAATSDGSTPASDFTLVDTAGRRMVIDPNEKTVLHFLTTSCADCLPTETALAQFQNDPHVRLISIDVTPQANDASTIQQFSKAAGAHWPYVLATDASLLERFHVTGLDTVVVLYHNQIIFEGVAPTPAQLQKVLA
ncbi:TlpA family protein disulfide reductase [Alicyclobacillus macrosporangiidus]|uniref:TlpA family protein disulfide reductase n=1 Tax=Alicyclobacillus macrosporangiidus TaxID=392015 RepID=UPI0005560DEE|nr:hypothetical protein [Alicyclobacillus macrosporangiidus]